MKHLTEEDIEALGEDANYRPSLMADIIEEVAAASQVRVVDILGHSRIRPIARARQMVMYVAYREGMTPSHIGRLLRRDHSTVLRGIESETKRRRHAASIKGN